MGGTILLTKILRWHPKPIHNAPPLRSRPDGSIVPKQVPRGIKSVEIADLYLELTEGSFLSAVAQAHGVHRDARPVFSSPTGDSFRMERAPLNAMKQPRMTALILVGLPDGNQNKRHVMSKLSV